MGSMNAVHWHLVLNHIPILGTFFSLLILGYGSWIRSQDVIRVSLALMIISGIAVVPVYYSGHDAEEIAEEITGVTEEAIEHHEEAAKTSYYITIVLAVVALGVMVQSVRNNRLSVWTLIIVGILAVITFVSFLRTANVGGLIRHPEINMKASDKT